jgi:hypothetical protein
VLEFQVEIVFVEFIVEPAELEITVEDVEQFVPSLICQVRTPESVVVALTVKDTS